MIDFLKLIRIPNLLIIALTQYLIRYCLMVEIVLQGSDTRVQNIAFTLNHFEFFLLVLSTVLIAAGGYIINDYFDTRIDRINKPDKVIVGQQVSWKHAILLHWILSIVGLLLGIFLAYRTGSVSLSGIHLLSIALLWVYSTNLKKTLLIGNIVISFLTALAIVTVGLFEPLIISPGNPTFLFILYYSGFAFLISMAREIVKDIEDAEGDVYYGARTLPIVAGVTTSKIIAGIILTGIAVFLTSVLYIQFKNNDFYSFWYFLLFLVLPIIFSIIYLFLSKKKEQYKRTSLLIKMIMLAGVLSMVVFYLSLS